MWEREMRDCFWSCLSEGFCRGHQFFGLGNRSISAPRGSSLTLPLNYQGWFPTFLIKEIFSAWVQQFRVFFSPILAPFLMTTPLNAMSGLLPNTQNLIRRQQ